MNKYDRMLAVNKQASEAKIEKARREIVRMVDDGEKVSIQKLMQRTGLSRGFFYKNPQVRKEIDRALEQQTGLADPRREVLDMAMNHELAMSQQEMERLRKENEQLRQELEVAKKALAKKNVGVLKKFM
jgi:transposase-like protein